ncbi:MAG: hypothetical protein M9932_12015 [Xanthobacteraceae bacterium]|nr:hypothetical protein [Xanthobacteraceae bacterium]
MRQRRHSTSTEADEPAGDGGPDEAACFIAGAVSELVPIARRHRLETLAFLLGMAKMEAEELVRASHLNNAH